MRNLLKFIIKFHVTFIFIVIEVIAFFLTIQNNTYQKASFINSSLEITGNIYKTYSSLTNYFNVKYENDILSRENTQLRRLIRTNYIYNNSYIYHNTDKLYKLKYDYINAKVVNNSVFKQTNYITLDKGSKQGVKTDMGVINYLGVVGIVKDVSNNFSLVIPLINTNAHISAKIKHSNYFGTISWDGTDYRFATLNEIPFHVKINIGDTVVTSGYSAIFPEGIMVGVITYYDFNQGKDFYNIKLKLSTNFIELNHVNIVYNLMQEEQKTLENKND